MPPNDDEGPSVPGASIPVEWKAGSEQVVATDRLVRKPTEKDVKFYGGPRKRLCGECKHFRFKAGQAEMERTKFLRELVYEHEWKTQHLGAPPGTMGLCHMRDSTITSPWAPECEQFYEAGRGDFRDR